MSRHSNIKVKKIVLASDHAGFKLKEVIKKFLIKKREKIKGIYSSKGPISVTTIEREKEKGKTSRELKSIHKIIKKIGSKNNQIGILICGSGIGMDMAANKHKNIRAALCYNIKSTKLSRQHNNANVMAIGARLTNKKVALKCVKTFITTNFKGGRHLRRTKKI